MTTLSATLPRTIRTANPVAQLLHLVAVARTRRALLALDNEALSDIGLTREEAVEEATRPFWDAPSHWRR